MTAALFIKPIRVSVEEIMDLLMINGKIRTMDAKGTIAQAVGIRQGRIDIIGTTQQVLQTKTQTDEMMDLKGKTVFPGFIDAHNHMVYYGTELMGINCRAESIRSIDDIVTEIAEKAASSPLRTAKPLKSAVLQKEPPIHPEVKLTETQPRVNPPGL
jgi:predicted amidohydrolase YtcJ